MTYALLDEQQRIRLRDLSKVRKDKMYTATPNVALGNYIQELHNMHPECFNATASELRDRVFFDEPSLPILYERHVRPITQSPYRNPRA